jgi:hypothetical protein
MSSKVEPVVDALLLLHYPAENDCRRAHLCSHCQGAAGVHSCGCWAPEGGTEVVCGHCRDKYGRSVEWPCPTVRAIGATLEQALEVNRAVEALERNQDAAAALDASLDGTASTVSWDPFVGVSEDSST